MNKYVKKQMYLAESRFYDKYLCKLNIKHLSMLIEWHTHNHNSGKKIPLDKQFGIRECVFCSRRFKDKNVK